MTGDAEQGEAEGETVDQGQEGLERYDDVDEAGEEFACQHGVLFYQFGEVVQSTCYGGEDGQLIPTARICGVTVLGFCGKKKGTKPYLWRG